ncbi:hypothetical protein BH11PAT3_BH11PAT3_3400 [soil metagenome]
MEQFKKSLTYCIDFLFPKSLSLQEIEGLSSGELLNLLPTSKEIQDDSLIVLFDYKDPLVREMIWELKYKGNRIIAKKFGEIIFDILQVEIAERALLDSTAWSTPLIIPMPTSTKRRRERGYNQTEILAEEIMKLSAGSGWSYNKDLLIKSTYTESQARTHATKREREHNLKNSFSIDGDAEIKGRAVILLDDVTTSGTTFREAKRTLMGAHAKRILCIALAH